MDASDSPVFCLLFARISMSICATHRRYKWKRRERSSFGCRSAALDRTAYIVVTLSHIVPPTLPHNSLYVPHRIRAPPPFDKWLLFGAGDTTRCAAKPPTPTRFAPRTMLFLLCAVSYNIFYVPCQWRTHWRCSRCVALRALFNSIINSGMVITKQGMTVEVMRGN